MSVLAPQLILMDVRMERMSGIEACREIKSLYPNVSILMITSYNGVTPPSILLRMWHGANTALLLLHQRILRRVLSHLHVEGLFRERPAPASPRRACNRHAGAGWQQ